MPRITIRAADPARRNRPPRRAARLLRRLSALATTAAERLTLPYRDVPPDSYRFPPLF